MQAVTASPADTGSDAREKECHGDTGGERPRGEEALLQSLLDLERARCACAVSMSRVSPRRGTRVTQSQLASTLYTAVQDGDAGLVRYLLDNGADVSRGTVHESPLHKACETADVGICEILLKNGANPNVLDGIFCTPLWRAVRNKYNDHIKLLLKYGANTNTGCQDGRNLSSPLLLAVKNRNLEAARQLLEHGAQVNQMDWFGETALQRASRLADLDIVDALIKHGANLDSQDRDQKTALYEACWRGKEDVVARLLAAGADPNLHREDTWSHHLYTPLHIAVTLSHVTVTRLLCASPRVDVARRDHCERTPLLLACELGCTDCAEQLLAHGGSDVNCQDIFKNAGITHAANQGNTRLLNMLLSDPRCDVDVQGSSGKSPLHLLAQKSDWVSVGRLLEHGARFTTLDSTQSTPLFHSVTMYDAHSTALFLKHGYLVTSPDLDNMRFLQVIGQKYRVSMLRSFVSAGWRPRSLSAPLILQYIAKLDHDAELVQWVRAQLCNPRPLGCLCRDVIRGCLLAHTRGRTTRGCLVNLPLPRSVTEYVGLDHVECGEPDL